ncbi:MULTISPECIES: hypothetical protein [Streptomyces]|uniref:hypothetical protein n=1 Tax=Streptomyces TaxID=1883 RepID=UPI00068FECD5|nr:hypothetical protein [Streptomyces griseolus]
MFGSVALAEQPGWRGRPYPSAAAARAGDEVIEHAAQTGWALFELPARITGQHDIEAFQTVLRIAERLLARRATTTCEENPEGHVLQPGDIAIGTAHRSQAHHIRALLACQYPQLHGVTVDTANSKAANSA